MKRTRIGNGYMQSGYGRGLRRTPPIFLINGKAYAKDTHNWNTDFEPLTGDLSGYVRVNSYMYDGKEQFDQVGRDEDHKFYNP